MRREIMSKAVGALSLALLLTIVYTTPALASEGEHALRWGDFAWRIINLIIFCAILWHFTGKLILNLFRNRKKQIQDSFDDLTSKREAAEANLAEIEKRISNLEQERQAILEESKIQAESIKKDIIEKANEQARQIVALAHATAESERRAMVQELRNEIADELINATKDKISGLLNKAEHEKLITNSLEKVVL